MTFKSDALKEGSLPLGTPLNKYAPNWPGLAGTRVAPKPRDLLMLRGNQCRCPTCDEYFGSVYAFDRHRVNTESPQLKRCLSSAEMSSSGWRQTPKGHWRSPLREAWRSSIATPERE